MTTTQTIRDIDSANIAGHLTVMARERPDDAAVICRAGRDWLGRAQYRHVSFAELDADSDRIARGLMALGVQPGMRVVLMVPPGVDFFALTFGLFKLGAVLVCVDPGIGLAHLKQCLNEAEPGAFIGTRKAHLARRLLGWAKGTNRINVVVARGTWLAGGVTLAHVREVGDPGGPGRLPHKSRPEDVAAILFTSGSTGPPKGAVYTHANFQAQVAALRDAYDIQPGEIDLATFPLFALYAPALGMTAVVPEMDFTRPARVNARKIAGAIDRFGVTNLFGSPALLDRVGQWGIRRGASFASLRRVVSAGAPVPARVVERFERLLDSGVQVFTPYGATECLPVASIGSQEILGETRWQTDAGRGVCVGRAVGDVAVRVIRITDEPIAQWSDELVLPPGEIGEIVVQGPVVTREYFGRDEATRMAKIPDPAAMHRPRDQRFWHRMGDVGYFDEGGRLWFCGRKSQRVRTESGDSFTICCEGPFNAHRHVRRTALVGVRRRGAADGASRLVLCVEVLPEARSADQERLRAELLAIARQYAHTREIEEILFHPRFPVDARHNAKINREKLAVWAAGRIGRDVEATGGGCRGGPPFQRGPAARTRRTGN